MTAYIILLVLLAFALSVALLVDPITRRSKTTRRVLPVLALVCVAGLAYGAILWSETLGRIHETHTVDEYQFKITSVRDPEYADEGGSGEDIAITIRKEGKVIAKEVHIGSIADRTTPPTFAVRRLQNESLIIVTRNDREHAVVFAYDTVSGEYYPQPYREDRIEADRNLCAALDARIRACLRDERYRLAHIYYF